MTQHPWKLIPTLLVVLLSRSVLACGSIEVLDGWIREPPPVVKVAAGYFTLKNNGGTQVSIKRIESPCCASVAMHQTEASGDHVRMSPMSQLNVPANAAISFSPGGAHLMLISPSSPLREGETVDIKFFCAVGSPVIVEFDVVAVR